MIDPIMLQETREAPSVVRRLLAENAARVQEIAAAVRERKPNFVMTIARGSSDHACAYLKYAFETELGLPVGSYAPSVSSVYKSNVNLSNALVIAVSQSGASPDVVGSVQAARASGALTIAVTNKPESPLAQAAEFVLPLHANEERAVAATKSYVASMVAPLQLIAELKGDASLSAAVANLPETLTAALAVEGVAKTRAERFRYAQAMVVLARGLHFGVALESALKLKETTGIQAEAYSAAEFSHGPVRIVEEGYPILAYLSRDETADLTLKAYQELEAKGAELILIGADAGDQLKAPVRMVVPATGHRATDPIASVLALYFLAGHLSITRGMNPDAPPSLRKVTLTQ